MKPHQGNCEGVFNYVHAREAKSNVTLKGCCQKQCIATNLPRAITEKEISVGDVDKIFAAQWLDDLHVVCGTKCNKVEILYHEDCLTPISFQSLSINPHLFF